MSKNRPTENEGSSGNHVPKLQTNVSRYPDNVTCRRAWCSSTSVGNQNLALRVTELYDETNLKAAGAEMSTDFCENDGRPEILSIDSDISSNDLIDGIEQADISEVSLDLTIKQENLTVDLKEVVSNHKESLRLSNEEYSFYTPPRVENKQEKKHEKGAFFSSDNCNADTSPVSTIRQPKADVVYGLSTVNSESQVSHPQLFTSGIEPAAQHGEGRFIQQAREAMDMKYTDMTHMQLKRSLDQIHGQNLRLGSLSADNLYNGVATVAHECCSNGNLPHRLTPRTIPASDPMLNGYTEAVYHNVDVSTAIPQSSKFDTILHVKDAMLQEKEAVILKLRLEISSLQHQVQEGEAALRQVVKSHIPASYAPTNLQSSVTRAAEVQTQKKIYELEQLLGKTESKLAEKSTYFKSERKEMEEKIEKLEDTLKIKEQSYLDFKKKHKSINERMEKYKKRVENLERYLGDLPTIEESNKLKTEADMLGEEREILVVEISSLKRKLADKIQTIVDKDRNVKQLQKDKKDYMSRITKLEEKLAKSEKSKEKLGKTERDELEDLRFKLIRLQKEKDDAVAMVAGIEKRLKQNQEKHKREIKRMQQKVEETEEISENYRRDLFLKQQSSNKVSTAAVSLSSQNQQLLEEKLTLQEKVKNLEKLQVNMREASRVCYRFHREAVAAVFDLKGITQVLLQTAQGADPNISALLGVRSDSAVGEEDLLLQTGLGGGDEVIAEGVESVEQYNKMLSEVRKLRQDIDQLRTLLSNKYADSIGENCITQ